MGSCRSMDEGDAADAADQSSLDSFGVFKKVSGSKNLSIVSFGLGFGRSSDNYDHRRSGLWMSSGSQAFKACAFPLEPRVEYKSGVSCINPFVLLDENGAFKSYVTFDYEEEDFLKKAAELLYEGRRNFRALEKEIKYSSTGVPHHDLLVYELRHVHKRLLAVSHGLALKFILEEGYSFKSIVDNYSQAESSLRGVLFQLRELVARVKDVDIDHVDYCYPILAKQTDSSGDQTHIGFSRCSIAGFQGPLSNGYKAKVPDK